MITRTITVVGYNVIYYDLENKCEGISYCETSKDKYDVKKLAKIYEDNNPLMKVLYLEIEKEETHKYVMPIEQFLNLATISD